MKKTVRTVVISLVVVAVVALIFTNYSFLFSKKVIGPIIEIDRVAPQDLILNTHQPDPLLVHTFAVAVRDQSGDIFTSSSVDERWAVARKGMCVEARFWPFPPWDFERFGTYKNAQLLQLRDCKALNLPEALQGVIPDAAIRSATPAVVPSATPATTP